MPRRLRHGLFLPPFNELSRPQLLVELAQSAEASGWDGFFLWDHVLRRPDEAPEVADPFISLAAVASATATIRIGTMVTPLVRRRPQVLCRQVVTLDHLSSGRVTHGLGLGVDTTGELSKFGELLDERERGDLLDEGAALLAEMMTGEEVSHEGRYFVCDRVRFLPGPVQSPRIPLWLGSRGRAPGLRSLRRAARYDGCFLIDADLPALERAVGVICEVRQSLEGFDLAVIDDGSELPLDKAEALGATWAMRRFRPDHPVAEVVRAAARGPSLSP